MHEHKPVLLPFFRKFRAMVPWIGLTMLGASFAGWLWQFRPYFEAVLTGLGVKL